MALAAVVERHDETRNLVKLKHCWPSEKLAWCCVPNRWKRFLLFEENLPEFNSCSVSWMSTSLAQLFVLCARSGHFEFVKCLLDKKVHPGVIPWDSEGLRALPVPAFSAFFEAYQANSVKIMHALLLRNYRWVGTGSLIYSHGQTFLEPVPLKVVTLETLAASGLTSSLPGLRPAEHSADALMSCASAGDSNGVETLLQSRADANMYSNAGFSALFCAAESIHRGSLACMEMLISAKANVNECSKKIQPHQDGYGTVDNQFGSRPLLTTAILRRDAAKVDLLLQNCANINLCTETGISPLHVAFSTSQMGLVRRLLQGGAIFHNCIRLDIPDNLEWAWRKMLRMLPPAPLLLYLSRHPAGLDMKEDFEGVINTDWSQPQPQIGNQTGFQQRYSSYCSDITEQHVQSSMTERKNLLSVFDKVSQTGKQWREQFQLASHEHRPDHHDVWVEFNMHLGWSSLVQMYSGCYVYFKEGMNWHQFKMKVFGLIIPLPLEKACLVPSKLIKFDSWREEILEKLNKKDEPQHR